MICDLDEGRYAAVGCLSCHADVLATLDMARPVRMYAVVLQCSECGEPLTEAWEL